MPGRARDRRRARRATAVARGARRRCAPAPFAAARARRRSASPAAGTHPFSLAEAQPITVARPLPRAASPRCATRRAASSASACTCTSPWAAPTRRLRVIEALCPDLPAAARAVGVEPVLARRADRASTRRGRDRVPVDAAQRAAAGVRELRATMPTRSSSSQRGRRVPGPLATSGGTPGRTRASAPIEVRCIDVQPRVVDARRARRRSIQALVRALGRRYDRGERFGAAEPADRR